jgi:hypothetical protein
MENGGNSDFSTKIEFYRNFTHSTHCAALKIFLFRTDMITGVAEGVKNDIF